MEQQRNFALLYDYLHFAKISMTTTEFRQPAARAATPGSIAMNPLIYRGLGKRAWLTRPSFGSRIRAVL
jgi:hypothetical protein